VRRGHRSACRPTAQKTRRGRCPSRSADNLVPCFSRESRQGNRESEQSDDASLETSISLSQQTPDEHIDAAVKEIHQAVARELLERIAGAPPSFFEQLVLDLLHGLGYGASQEDLERVGGAGDGGFDGIISLDPLGFEKSTDRQPR